MFEEPPIDPEWWGRHSNPRAEDDRQGLDAVLDALPLERRLADRIEERRAMTTRFIAEELSFLDDLRLETERLTGASWTQRDSLAWRELRAEVAALLRVHEKAAERRLDFARDLVHRFPATLDGLHHAFFTERHAQIVVEQAVGLPENLTGEYERRLLPHADLVPSRFEKVAATIRADLAPADLEERHREAAQQRRTALEAAPDGMAWYGALLPAPEAIGAAAAVNGLARSLLVDGEERTLAQIEADVFRDLLIDAAGVTLPTVEGTEPVPTPAARRGVSPEVLVHVPVLTAMGRSDAPAVLEGYGPIDGETARRVAGCATGFLRMLTDPETGAALSFGRATYRVPAELRRYLRVRDEVCRFVGCTRAASRCDVDHTVPWAEDGETVAHNLAHLCRGHHRLKGGSRWRATQSATGDGTITWTSPTGRTYTSRPATKLPPPGRRTGPPGSRPIVQRSRSETPAPF
ncbi:HNH endonuclease signature motif containing protein [Naasia sp. SYSU D00948]|uniref:HNH endonuclease n=1 Tax=Naasia sp. SYSU D00948 TaxID=2817379 RepID=UPI001B30AA48|nr:HNH endonuclease signature motif containing protein [Naasia sp. SYSU D00948]